MTQSLNSIFPLDLCKMNMLLSNMIYKTGNTQEVIWKSYPSTEQIGQNTKTTPDTLFRV